MAASISSLFVADSPTVWAGLGFDVSDRVTVVSGIAHVLASIEGKRGIRAWSLDGADGRVDGLHVMEDAPAAPMAASAGAHPNGVVELDHLVVITPDHPRTIAAFEDAGLALRRTRESDTYGAPMLQGFFKLGSVVLEVVGPKEPAGDGPARFYGLAWTVADLDETARFLGDRLHAPKPAVQEGRRIATLDKGAGSTVAMAFMSR